MSGTPSPPERLRALGAAVTIGTDRTGGDQSAADSLLTDAANAGIQARAGWRPQTHPGRLPDPPHDDRPAAPANAIATLLRLLADPDPALIEEWAQLALSHGVRVDGAAAPLVLEWWARQPRRSESVFAALGRRGEWLASLNADWRKPVATLDIPADADDVWQSGKSAERLAILTSVRRQDPARARALIESTWQSDNANDRQRFLEALAEQRSMADEHFLETALDDRSKLVRRQAAALLALIPESRLRQRLSDSAEAIITVRTSRGTLLSRSRQQIVLVPPDSFAAFWERDGIEERAPEGVGQKAWWMRQILARAGLAVWTERSEMTPEGILESLKKDDYFGDAMQALVSAAASAGDPGVEHGPGSSSARSELDRPRLDCRAPRRAPGRSARGTVARDANEGAADVCRSVDRPDIVRPPVVAGVLHGSDEDPERKGYKRAGGCMAPHSRA